MMKQEGLYQNKVNSGLASTSAWCPQQSPGATSCVINNGVMFRGKDRWIKRLGELSERKESRVEKVLMKQLIE